MPKNLKNRFRTELIRQRKNARKFGGREKLKNCTMGSTLTTLISTLIALIWLI